jgi:hypothetical protein
VNYNDKDDQKLTINPALARIHAYLGLNDNPPILERMQIEPRHWRYMTQHFESRFKGLVGSSHALKSGLR